MIEQFLYDVSNLLSICLTGHLLIGHPHDTPHILHALGTCLGDDTCHDALYFLSRQRLGEIFLHHSYLSKFLLGELRPIGLPIGSGTLLPLLDKFLDDLQCLVVG